MGVARQKRPPRSHSRAPVEVPSTYIRLSTAILVPCFAAAGLVAALSPQGPHSTTRLTIAGLIFATTIPIGVLMIQPRMWLIGWQQPNRRGQIVSMAFISYADIGLGAVLFTFVDHEAAMYGTALFAIVGVYAGQFTNPRTVIAHVTITSVTITALAWLTWQQGHHDTAGVAARWIVSMLTANATLAMLSGFIRSVQNALDTQLDHATRDPLTRLLNRRGLEVQAEQLLQTRSQPIGFVALDLDDFKSVNDSHGHSAGDMVLVLVGTRLRRVLGPDATIARIGGEEFAAVLDTSEGDILEAANAIRIALHDPNDEVPVTVSVGTSTVTIDDDVGVDPVNALSEGLRRADIALYAAKRAGRNRVRTYDPSHDEDSRPERPAIRNRQAPFQNR
jgi:two-component system cell cycle response regulator